MNRTADAVAAYESALAGYELLEDQLGQALVHGGLGRLHNGVHDFMRALPHFNAALGLWPAAREEAKFAALLLEFSTATYESGDSGMENILTERALALAERLGDPMLLAHALWRSAVQRFRHDPRPRIRIEREIHAIGLAQRARDWRTLSRLYRWRSATSSHSTIALGWD